MTAHGYPERFHIDVTGANLTPFRFVSWPQTEEIRYYDRRYTLTPGQTGYGVNHTCEDGQACGPALHLADFTTTPLRALCGWHDVSWDVDQETMLLVSSWVSHVMASYDSWKADQA